MRCCEAHWADMRKAVEDRGMSHLIARDSDEAAENLILQIEGDESINTWDPLMAMNTNFMGAAIRLGGLEMLCVKDDGSDYCPLCEARDRAEEPDTDASWIEDCADVMLEYANRMGLM